MLSKNRHFQKKRGLTRMPRGVPGERRQPLKKKNISQHMFADKRNHIDIDGTYPCATNSVVLRTKSAKSAARARRATRTTMSGFCFFFSKRIRGRNGKQVTVVACIDDVDQNRHLTDLERRMNDLCRRDANNDVFERRATRRNRIGRTSECTRRSELSSGSSDDALPCTIA